MGIYTNTGLVKHAEMALALNTKYMWGGVLRPITDAYIKMLRGIYGINSNTGYTEARYRELASYVGKGYYGCDCVGLIKSYYWSGKADGGVGSPNYGQLGYPDVNANYMYQQSKNKGSIKTLPEVPGLIVYSKTHPHVGIYVGNGYTIECTLGRGDGVVKRKLDSFWEYWFECPYIEYPKAKPTPTTKTTPIKYIYQAISTAAIRTDASKSAKIYSRVAKWKFYTADALNETGTWFKHTGQNAWSKLDDGGSLFSKVGDYVVKTTTTKVNVRSSPGVSSNKVATLDKGTKVYVWCCEPIRMGDYNWYKIIYNNTVAYIASDYVK